MTETSRRSARTRVLGLALLAFLLLLVAPASASALLAIQTPVAGSTTGATPTFSGSTEDLTDPVDVLLYAGSSATGAPVRELDATPPFVSGWSVGMGAGEALPAGTYTVVVEQAELLGLGESAKTEPITFTVSTSPPVLTIAQPSSPTGERTPKFSGETSEDGEVVVHVFEGATEVATAVAMASAGTWSTSALDEELPAGRHTFTAFATEASGIGNGEGTSNTVRFEVNTEAPALTLKGPPALSDETEPSFSGTTSEDGEVVVHVFEGSTEVAKAKAVASGGAWSTGELSKALPSGEHAFTAYATERSGLGNPEGRSATVSFEVDTEAPALTIVGPPSPSNETLPSFSGTTSEDGEVVVHVFEGSTEVAKTKTTASAGVWTTEGLNKVLPSGDHVFKAYATEESRLGNGEGRSATVSFEVDTEAPALTIAQPRTPSANTTPSFSGTTSEAGEVIVHVFEGSTEVAQTSTTASRGAWSTEGLSVPLASGKHTFTAYATERSGLGNSEGRSTTVAFDVDTEGPVVTLSRPATPSNQTEPTFSGTASEDTQVVVHVLEGSNEVASVATTAASGTWSAKLSKALPSGKHSFTAFATEASGIGGPEGKSASVGFEVDTEAPVVTIVGPGSPTSETTPVFSGSASEAGEVVVHVFEGSTEVSKGKASVSGGVWSTEALSKVLPSGKHSFTAFATEKSGIGNAEGKSATVSFEVDTEAPALTVDQPVSPSNKTEPSFSGSASEAGEVVVHVLEGSGEVASASATASGGTWSTKALGKALPSGKHTFTAFATEKSGLGNGEGRSASVSFEVDTEPPVVTLNQPVSPSNKTEPSFSGSASEATEVTVHVLLEGSEVASATTTASGGAWSAALSKALPSGKHSFTAFATEKSGLDNGEGRSVSVGFEVDTEAPVVTIVGPGSPTSETTPVFSGSASEAGEVVVHVFEGSTEVSKGKASVSGGVWSTEALSKVLPSGKHSFTAFATEKSGIGNAEGKSATVSFEVDTEAPTLTLNQPVSPSNKTQPSFSGSAGEDGEVVVHVFEGSSEVASATANASGGAWSTSPLGKALKSGKHSFTAFATEKSGLGNPEGKSATVGFEVNTEAPVVTLAQPASPSNKTQPSFSGSASEATEVTVHVLLEGSEVQSVTTTASGGAWSAALSKALPSGKHDFTAFATEKSGLGNPEGKSASVGFEVDTEAPVVTLAQPPTPSSDTLPSFSGTASEETEVTVHVLEGSTEVAKAKTTATGGVWTSEGLNKVLPSGKHSFTAFATEKSGIGNAEGKSATVSFEVNTEAPTLTLNQPVSPSNKTQPVFSGSASEAGEVVVHVLEGSTEVASATASASGGAWSAGALSRALPSGKHTFTAFATEKSGLGNGEGRSATVSFEVDTEPPVVTLNQPVSPSNKTEPSFSGSASEATEVTVHVLLEGSEVQSVTTTASGGAWSAALSKALPSGKHDFTAFATEKSGLGNPEGKSAGVSFEVDTEPPAVTLAQPPTPSSNTLPSFSGTASEAGEVVVHVFEGSTEVSKGKATAFGGLWATEALTKMLPSGKHTFTAFATEKSGLGNAEGKSATVSFEVNTETPVVTLNQPASPSNVTTPSFSGSASEATEVTVHVFEGSSEVASATTTASGGAWSTSTLSKALRSGKHGFTAFATEKSGLGNGEGKSATVSFEVDTEPPVVTLGQPVSPSNVTTPSFSGSASEATEVTVHVFEGTSEVASGSATASGGGWSIKALSKPLLSGKHTFTAFATEKSGLGNAEGKSATVSFEVNTEPPFVTLAQPVGQSNKTQPSFSGTTNEAGEVVVHVFEGTSEIASATASTSGGAWSTKALGKALPSGKHTFTAFATEKSALGNPEGKSATVSFEVNTEPPAVTLGQPVSPSNVTQPSFSGSASEATEVTVHVLEGSSEVASATTTAAGGTWATGPLSKALRSGKHSFTAFATEKSGLGNGEGRSATVSFEVNTEAPVVTLGQPVSPSNKTEPPFSGSASEATEVTVHVLLEGSEVASATTTASGGAWSTSTLNKALPLGKHSFTAFATEKSAVGNAEGKSATVGFEVNTEPPAVTSSQPASPSNDVTPSFSGTASEATEVTVHVLLEGSEVAAGTTTASGGNWSIKTLSRELPKGKHDFTAFATEKSGLGNKEGHSATVSFEVNTEPPVVVLGQPASPSNKTEPSFSGTASEATEVTVHVLLEGSEVASATTTASGGTWSTKALSKALLTSGKRTFTAFATEKSGIGNGEGHSATVSFEVNTEPPVVTLNQPVSPSNKTEPSFSGSASEATEVTVHVLEGSSEVASATTTAFGGVWSTSSLSKALPSGKHGFTAFATEKSGIGNGEGKSASVSFEVNTEPPVVSLVQPVSPSNRTEPSFSGSASEATEVTVHVFEGSIEVASATTTASAGAWSTGSLSKALPSGKHSFTAFATEKSGIGNGEGKSASVSFEVNTQPPKVTLNPPLEVSNDQTPSFSGEASEAGSVTVKVFKGAKPEGTLVATLKAEVSGGKWKTASLEPPLANPQQYTAIAIEPSALGNTAGESTPATFEVNAKAPTIELLALPARSNDTHPSFSGTVSNKPGKIVKVRIYEGRTAVVEVAEVQAEVTAGKTSWSTKPLVEALKPGQHTFTAVASVESAQEGNPAGKSAPVTFEVDTEPPTVTLSQPPSRSNQTKPTFTGEASESGEVTVEVFAGAKAEGTPVASAKDVAEPNVGGFAWSAGLTAALADGEYTAIAKQQSAIGNEAGTSSPVSFSIDTKPPEVTLDPPRSPSSNHFPSFSGTASEGAPVTVDVYRGATATGSPVAKIEAEVAGGEWTTGRPSESLEYGEYVAVARQESSIGNAPGASAPAKLVLEAIPPAATTEAANEVARSSAALYASVNPLGGPISACNFEWGTTTAYGHTVECGFVSGASAFPSEATGFVPVFARIFGLHPSTTYHVRIVAVGEGGTADGGDETFTTEEALIFPEKEAPKAPPPPASHPPAAIGVGSFFAAQLLPSGKAARIGTLLKFGLFKQRFRAPEAGTEVVKWYFLPPGAKLAKASKKAQPVLVASGTIVFRVAGSAEMKIRLSSRGKALLKRSKRLRLTATSTFTPVGEPAVTTSAAFQLTR
jgi:large repetitive protein